MLRTICFLPQLHTMVCLELFSTTFLQLPIHSAPSSTHCQCQGLIRTQNLCADPHAWVILNHSVNPCSMRISLYHCPLLDLCGYKLRYDGIWSRVQSCFSFASFILSTGCELNLSVCLSSWSNWTTMKNACYWIIDHAWCRKLWAVLMTSSATFLHSCDTVYLSQYVKLCT